MEKIDVKDPAGEYIEKMLTLKKQANEILQKHGDKIQAIEWPKEFWYIRAHPEKENELGFLEKYLEDFSDFLNAFNIKDVFDKHADRRDFEHESGQEYKNFADKNKVGRNVFSIVTLLQNSLEESAVLYNKTLADTVSDELKNKIFSLDLGEESDEASKVSNIIAEIDAILKDFVNELEEKGFLIVHRFCIVDFEDDFSSD